jgi:hypothetical protein
MDYHIRYLTNDGRSDIIEVGKLGRVCKNVML